MVTCSLLLTTLLSITHGGRQARSQLNQGHSGTEHRQLQIMERIQEPRELKGDSLGPRPGPEEGDVVVMGTGKVPGFSE